MARFLSIALLCLTATACFDSKNDSSPVPDQTGSSIDFSPSATTADRPPLDGVLPADLLPPR